MNAINLSFANETVKKQWNLSATPLQGNITKKEGNFKIGNKTRKNIFDLILRDGSFVEITQNGYLYALDFINQLPY